jgi:hypothetical protein
VVDQEDLIYRDSYVFDTKITISPISVSRSNLYDKLGRCITFLEAAQATIVPYAVKITFPFLEFIGLCIEKYSHEERVFVNKHWYEVMCRVESMSIRESVNIPKSFSTIFEPFNEENPSRVYREFPSEVRDLFLQTIVKPKHFSKSLSFLVNANIMVIEVQWVISLLSKVLGLYNDKYVVEVMLGFILTFLKSKSGLSVHIGFDQFIANNIHKKIVNFHSLRN